MPEPIKSVKSELWVFDIETVPCVETGRKVYDGLDKEDDRNVLAHMYEKAGADTDNPKPMVKTILQRVVAVSALVRKETREGVTLSLHSLPTGTDFDELTIIETFLTQIGTRRPQIAGFNHSSFDFPVLFQRAIIHGIEIGNFCVRPEKPWEPLPDYFNDKNDWNVDLMKLIGGWGKATPSLSEIAKACGIPAKLGVDGSQVSDMWFSGLDERRKAIVDYCELDALATYLLWLRVACVSGLFTRLEMFTEQEIFAQLLEDLRAEKPHVGEFLDAWRNGNKAMEVAA